MSEDHVPSRALHWKDWGVVKEAEVEITTIDGKRVGSSVDHPAHYNDLPAVCDKCGEHIECIQVVRHMNFNVGNVIKYLWRAGLKDRDAEIEDLEKAAWYP